MDAPTIVYVCTTCRAEGEAPLAVDQRAGARLFTALKAAVGSTESVDVVPVECLSVCRRPCTVGFASPGKWTYVYGDLPPDTATPVILDALRLYAAAPDGLVPWKLRSDPIKKGVVARLPPRSAPAGEKPR